MKTVNGSRNGTDEGQSEDDVPSPRSGATLDGWRLGFLNGPTYVLTKPVDGSGVPPKVIDRALEEAGYEPLITDKTLAKAPSVFDTIRIAVRRTDLVVADLTGNDPNVLYVVGLAHGRGIPVVLLVHASAKQVPPPVHGNQFFVYNPSDPDSFVLGVRNAARRELAVMAPA